MKYFVDSLKLAFAKLMSNSENREEKRSKDMLESHKPETKNHCHLWFTFLVPHSVALPCNTTYSNNIFMFTVILVSN